MPFNKRITDLVDYTSVLPYASELFGIYQPLIGWKSKRIADRFYSGFQKDKMQLLNRLKNEFNGLVDIKYRPDCQVDIQIKPGALISGKLKSFDSVVLERIAQNLPPYEEYKPRMWKEFINEDRLNVIYTEFVVPTYSRLYFDICNGHFQGHNPDILNNKGALVATLENQLRYESSISGALLFLVAEGNHQALADIFYAVKDNKQQAVELMKMLSAANSQDAYLNINNLDPKDKEHINSVALSPISVVHLFRQYFFELDTFLGTPVEHVWLSPGSTVELLEVHTRKTIEERTIENSLESLIKTEKSLTTEEELSDAVKMDNKEDIKFGASVTASYASVTATSSFDFNNSQQKAREEMHKHTRQQTEKLSSEIRKNYKSTFKTVTEITDTSSKRYVLYNNTPDLINYELRRKMRQVGVQVQDVGTYLCWQTYVDDPGKDLGLAKLMHIAKPADLSNIPHPEEILPQSDFKQELNPVKLPFVPLNDHDDTDELYIYGGEENEDDEEDKYRIQYQFEQSISCEKTDYVLESVSLQVTEGNAEVEVTGINTIGNRGVFTIVLKSVLFGDRDSVMVRPTVFWKSTQDTAKIEALNEANRKEFKAKEKLEMEKAFVTAAKERIKLASNIKHRPSEELREEERIVVYRALIQEMLMKNVPMPDDRTRHVVAELISSIFDVDKMLYFVAPEWWRPRLHPSSQQIGEAPNRNDIAKPKTGNKSVDIASQSIINKSLSITKMLNKKGNIKILDDTSIGWGGINEANRDNYYITEDSEPARLGSSLGWLLQLDGDNMRNAFLNAPWVKAVIPIRPGKEEAAINWLKGVEGMNGITDDVIYRSSNPNEKDLNGNPLDGQRMIDVLIDLTKKIQIKHEEGIQMGKYPKASEVANPELVDEANTVTSTPIDRVYEHGFYPLKGGFKAVVEQNYEIVSQWIEVLPTDQVVPVEVKYNPKTGRQI